MTKFRQNCFFLHLFIIIHFFGQKINAFLKQKFFFVRFIRSSRRRWWYRVDVVCTRRTEVIFEISNRVEHAVHNACQGIYHFTVMYKVYKITMFLRVCVSYGPENFTVILH